MYEDKIDLFDYENKGKKNKVAGHLKVKYCFADHGENECQYKNNPDLNVLDQDTFQENSVTEEKNT